MYNYKIDKIIFNEGTELPLGALTVIVGPNNSGKSRILRDISELVTKMVPHTIVAKDVDSDFQNPLRS